MDIDGEPYLEGSRTIPTYLVGDQRVEPRTRPDGVEYRHVSLDLVIVRRDRRRAVVRVDIVDVTVCLHHRFESTHREKREAYEPLRRAIAAHLRIGDDKVTVRTLALGVLGYIPESAVATLAGLGIKGPIARRLLTASSTVCSIYSARCCQTRRKLEAVVMDPQGICTRLRQRGRRTAARTV